ncbi:MAG: hypothetical protein FJW40_20895 [Acidobacteria bacterium]|nr:hypothetical protein [Acidobacteriota bacterium]
MPGLNLGPVCTAELAAIGITAVEQIRELGWREVCLRWVEAYPSRINLNAFTGVIGAEHGVHWQRVDPALKQEARRLIQRLRAAR